MKLINKFIIYITSFCIIITSILTVIDLCCFDNNFYYKEYEKNNTLELVNTTQDDLEYITTTTLDYLKNKNDDLNIMFHEDGILMPVFEDIEIIHMKDVKDLYQNVLKLRLIMVFIFIIGLIYIFINKLSIKKEFITVLVLILVSLCLLGISCIVDFDSFWTSFHKVFFTKNDYWLLDPRTCILVNLFTSEFFFDLCIKICVISIIVILFITGLVFIYEKKYR